MQSLHTKRTQKCRQHVMPGAAREAAPPAREACASRVSRSVLDAHITLSPHTTLPPLRLAPLPFTPLRAGVYAYIVSVFPGSSCNTFLNVTACPPAVTCATERVVTLPQPGSMCIQTALNQSFIYNVTAPPGITPVVTVVPPLPGSMIFGLGERRRFQGSRAGTDGQGQRCSYPLQAPHVWCTGQPPKVQAFSKA